MCFGICSCRPSAGVGGRRLRARLVKQSVLPLFIDKETTNDDEDDDDKTQSTKRSMQKQHSIEHSHK